MEEIDGVPTLGRFRETVDKTCMRERDRLLIKTFYLTACRGSELTTHQNPYDLKEKKVRLAYGKYATFKMATFDHEEEKVRHKVLLLRLAVAKRKLKTKKTKTEQQRLKLVFKTIALPTDPRYEPWTKDLMAYILKRGTLNFDLSRSRIRQIVIENLRELDRDITTKSLRHYRLSHLAEDYHMTRENLMLVAGWTWQGAFGGQGGQLDTYVHLTWQSYFKKLLRPL